jgi:hypothetical protein
MDLSGVRIQALNQMFNVLRDEGHTVIIDLGRGTLPLMWHALAHCDWVNVVTSADPTSRRLAKIAVDSLPDHDVDPRSILLIFNDSTNKQPADISSGLPRTPDVFIPYTEAFDDFVDTTPFAHLWSIMVSDAETAPTSSV